MANTNRQMVIKISIIVSIGLLLLLFSQVLLAEDNKYFSGSYISFEGGQQNIFSGALIDEQDILQESMKLVLEAGIGYRHQFDTGWVIGGTIKFGSMDGSLSLNDPLPDIQQIKYDSTTQLSYGVEVGNTFGSDHKNLGFVYAYQTDRDFDVSITATNGIFTQTDGQGMIRYGIGYERALTDYLNLRGSIGKISVDFGNPNRNIEVDGEIDFSVGIIYQF